MAVLGDHAVVLGASMGGLLAARVLSEQYHRVTIVERDELNDEPIPRRGVPQGRHGHVLLARGAQILEELFPGFGDELVRDGAATLSTEMTRIQVAIAGHVLAHHTDVESPDAARLYFPSRPLLERNVRRRVRAIDTVTILDGHDVVGLTCTPDAGRVTGARVVSHGGEDPRVTAADLVVDATGRGSRTPTFLREIGYSRPPTDELVVKLAYASQLLRIPAGTLPEQMIGYFPAPGRPRTWTIVGHENDTWMMTVGSMCGHDAPANRSEMLTFGVGFAPPHAVAAVRAATPLGEVEHYRVPSNRWRRYDKMKRFPQGLLVFGDAICSFNPVYGQGMTMAAIESTILRECLRRGDRDVSRRFFRASARRLRVAWQTAVGSDLSLPELAGPRPLSMRLSNAYLDRVMRAAETDIDIAVQLFRVTGMMDSPVQLLRPDFMARVARVNLRRPGPTAALQPVAASARETA
ncbi:FAD-dependent monooxygenase [Mycolicibacterium fluoranthenivorans]|uniref:FAD-dependent monooxygenase n=1 Tax=Mycolicibacterium fluoranthenivorans TaxID=258505 RepID=A0A7G8PLL3_9MYCO|nr:FAD-dependent monooxygenase [Mycolicibacterium fluoranthenivorans]QNJ95229.1 FAD-dependent monooxygenase [Mycolicibacterium fluoranthenivorans]